MRKKSAKTLARSDAESGLPARPWNQTGAMYEGKKPRAVEAPVIAEDRHDGSCPRTPARNGAGRTKAG
jgi:hypothetical protein